MIPQLYRRTQIKERNTPIDPSILFETRSELAAAITVAGVTSALYAIFKKRKKSKDVESEKSKAAKSAAVMARRLHRAAKSAGNTKVATVTMQHAKRYEQIAKTANYKALAKQAAIKAAKSAAKKGITG